MLFGGVFGPFSGDLRRAKCRCFLALEWRFGGEKIVLRDVFLLFFGVGRERACAEKIGGNLLLYHKIVQIAFRPSSGVKMP